MQDRTDAGQNGCRTDQVQYGTDAGQDGCEKRFWCVPLSLNTLSWIPASQGLNFVALSLVTQPKMCPVPSSAVRKLLKFSFLLKLIRKIKPIGLTL